MTLATSSATEYTADVFQRTVEYVRDRGEREGLEHLADYRRHHVGHDIGLDVYDTTVIDETSDRLESGMVVCVETPYYEIGTAGVQVEDEVLITDRGTERLSTAPESLPVVG